MHPALVDVDTLAALVREPDVAIVDCRFDLFDTASGRRAYLEAHIPGAVYADLDRDLSGPPLTDRGRHPLPSAESLRALFSRLGIDAATRVVAYDAADGAHAARLWWLLHYMGHAAVSVLDGGWRAWRARDLPAETGDETRAARVFPGDPRRDRLVVIDEVPDVRRLVDARAAARYRGEHEPLDPVAGHIPGARNLCYTSNLDSSGRFLAPAVVRDALLGALAGVEPAEATYYCGSGVTACHLLLAAAHAGLPPGRLYAGSWSEWCSQPNRPVATGSETG